MPDHMSTPGVYVEEMPSSSHAIRGLGTAATGFVDVFERGPVNEATRVDSMVEFQRTFGGLWDPSEASFGISQFFLNGGQSAWVVRLQPTSSVTASCTDFGVVTFEASSPGAWGNAIEVAVSYDKPPASAGTSSGSRVRSASNTFTLMVRELTQRTNGRAARVRKTEVYQKLTIGGPDRDVFTVLERERSMVRAVPAVTDPSVRSSARGPFPDTLSADQSGEIATAMNDLGSESFQPLTKGVDWTKAELQQTPTNNVPGLVAALIVQAGEHGDANDPDNADGGVNGVAALGTIRTETVNLLCLPATALMESESRAAVLAMATKFCADHRAFFLVDTPIAVGRRTQMSPNQMVAHYEAEQLAELAEDAAVYYPPVAIPNPLDEFRPRVVGPSGTIAGLMARTDAGAGVWKAPAGTTGTLQGAVPVVDMNDEQTSRLTELGINVLREFPVYGSVCWGARTLAGADDIASQWKYVPVRRTALFIEDTLHRSTKWAVFEPNDEPLWAQLRLAIGTWMHDLWRQGAFQGSSPDEGYFVRCDPSTTSQRDIDNGVVTVVVGFAPLKPAEFVIVHIRQNTLPSTGGH